MQSPPGALSPVEDKANNNYYYDALQLEPEPGAMARATVMSLMSLSLATAHQSLQFLPRDALSCKARYWDRMLSVRLSVSLSVTLVDCDH